MPVVDEVSRHFNSNSKGLDYGSGPQPVLQELLKRNNILTDVYDPYFAPRNLNENGAYDFITCTETAEHFYNPSFEFEKIFHLLKPNGYLFLMTKLFTPELEIKKWDYARDTSHVCFYSMQSLEWICKKYSRKLTVVTPRFFILN